MSPIISVTKTISALVIKGSVFAGHTVAENGGVGNIAPSPLATIKNVPLVAGTGAVATVEYARFL